MLPHQPNQSVIDSIHCLQELAASSEPVGVREMARRMDLNPTRVNRLLMTMAHMGVAVRNARGKYSPGPGLYVLSAQNLFVSGFLKHALATLQELKELELVVAMGTLWRNQVSYIYHYAPGMPDSQALGRISFVPATQSSIGMSLLAQQPDEAVRSYYGDEPIFGYEKDGLPGLLKDLATYRRQGYALFRPPHNPDVMTLGITVGENKPWAIALSGEFSEADAPALYERLRHATEDW